MLISVTAMLQFKCELTLRFLSYTCEFANGCSDHCMPAL